MLPVSRISVMILSIVLIGVSSWLWVRSYDFASDVVSWQRPGGIAYAAVSREGILFLTRAHLSSPNAPTGWLCRVDNNGGLTHQWHSDIRSRLGLRLVETCIPRQWPEGGYGSEGGALARSIYLPYWVPVTLFALYPCWRWWSTFRQRRRMPGCCEKCGYDLRASTDRCPECGTEIP
jgi:hypothetical protein